MLTGLSQTRHSFLSRFLAGFIARQRRKVREEDQDIFIVISGDVRSGKSTLAIHLARAMDECFNPSENTIYADGNFGDLLALVEESDSARAVHVDELQWIAFAHDWQKADAKMMSKIMMTVGSYNLVFISCIPHIADIHIYLRGHRASYWFHVITQEYRDHDGKGHTRRGLMELARPNKSKYEKKIYWEDIPARGDTFTFPPPGALYHEKYLPRKIKAARGRVAA